MGGWEAEQKNHTWELKTMPSFNLIVKIDIKITKEEQN